MSTTTKAPVFCPNCKKSNTFMRQPERDVMVGDSGNKVGWERWTCQTPGCKYTTIEPTEVMLCRSSRNITKDASAVLNHSGMGHATQIQGSAMNAKPKSKSRRIGVKNPSKLLDK